MSSSCQSIGTPSQFKEIFDAALSEYKTKTGNDLINNPLAKKLQCCASAEAVLGIIQCQVKEFDEFRDGDTSLMKWIGPSVDVLFTISSTLGAGVSTVRSMICDDLRVALYNHHRAADSPCKCGLYRNRSSPHCPFFKPFFCVTYCRPF